MMNKRILTITFLLSFIVYIFLYQIFLLQNLLKYVEFINAAFILFITFLAILLLGYRQDKYTILKKKVFVMVIISLVFFFTISYGAGLFVGFLKNSYSLNLSSIIDNIIAPIIVIIGIEVLRYTLVSANRDRKYILVLIAIGIALFEIFTSIKVSSLNDFSSIFKISTITILPVFIRNLVFTYLTYEVGYRPAIIYRLFMEIYIFIIPIVPDFGDYINSMIGICFPIFLYIYATRIIHEHYDGIQHDFNKRTFQWTDIPIIAFILVFVCLLSGHFPYSIIGVGSGSMMPVISRGDAVIVHRISSRDQIKVGDIITYNNDGKTVIHRLIEIERVGGKVYYRTKGDANNTQDNVNLEFKDIKGKVNLRIPYIAYPSLFLT